MLLFCPALSPGVGSGIPAQWGPYNWEPCLLFSPLPPTSSPFHFPPLISYLYSLSEHMDCFFFLRESSVHIKDPGWAGQFVAPFPDSSPSTSHSRPSLHCNHLPRMLHCSSISAQRLYRAMCCVCSPHRADVVHSRTLDFSVAKSLQDHVRLSKWACVIDNSLSIKSRFYHTLIRKSRWIEEEENQWKIT